MGPQDSALGQIPASHGWAAVKRNTAPHHKCEASVARPVVLHTDARLGECLSTRLEAAPIEVRDVCLVNSSTSDAPNVNLRPRFP